MSFDLMKHIPLSSAYLCQDCDAVGNSSMQCPACASEVLMGLARVFGRREDASAPGALHLTALAA
jgi:hypothetical protein